MIEKNLGKNRKDSRKEFEKEFGKTRKEFSKVPGGK